MSTALGVKDKNNTNSLKVTPEILYQNWRHCCLSKGIDTPHWHQLHVIQRQLWEHFHVRMSGTGKYVETFD